VPADLETSASIALGKRDPEVRVALEELKTHARLARERVALATVQ
jgi:hypothetical protein